MCQTIACSLASSRLDYANSLFVGVSNLELKRLQRIQNSLARVPLRTCSSVLLHELHWLPVEFRIKFKLACLTYKALSTSTPTYIHALLTPYIPPRCLRSSSTGLLAEPRCRTVMGSRAFHSSSPRNGIDYHFLFVAQLHILSSKATQNSLFLLGFQGFRNLSASSPGG